jgi:putative DNA primase/helicase
MPRDPEESIRQLIEAAPDVAADDDAPRLSEQWLALRFVDQHRGDMRFTHLWNQWHLWNGVRWVRDDRLEAFSRAQELCRRIAREMNKSKARLYITKASTRAAVISLARENPALAMRPTVWDADDWLFGTPNGIVDLCTGALVGPDRSRYVTKCAAASPGGDCPLWRQTILEICNNDADLVTFIKRWFGYCLTGSTREELLVFFQGEGGNGKGTVIETIQFVMGEYAVPVPIATLVATRHPEHPTEIAKLYKVRLAVASETDDGARINAARVKLLTGGDRLTGRFMRADYFDFAPTHKLTISGNAPLALGRSDKAIERRWRTVNFTRSFVGDRADTKLKEKLHAEAGGILAWLIEGCLEWQRDGLTYPKAVRAATEEYIKTQDDISIFVGDECIVEPVTDLNVGPKWRSPARPIYEAWRLWCARGGVFAGTFSDFCNRMRGRYKVTNTDNRPEIWGIRLAAHDPSG